MRAVIGADLDLAAHADAIEHTALLGGYVVIERHERRVLSQAEREQWARDAAVIREAALGGRGEKA